MEAVTSTLRGIVAVREQHTETLDKRGPLEQGMIPDEAVSNTTMPLMTNKPEPGSDREG